MNLKRLALLPAVVLIMASCAAEDRHAGQDGQDHEEHDVSVTIWSGGMELFAEFHPPVRGEQTEFTVLLTRLEDFALGEDAIRHEILGTHAERDVRALNPGLAMATLRVAPAADGESGKEISHH